MPKHFSIGPKAFVTILINRENTTKTIDFSLSYLFF